MQYKTELHCHSSEVSPCADLTVAEVTERYIAAGYTTVVLTNHYCDSVINNAGETWEEKIGHYLSAYHAMKKYAGDRLNILLGCELRFTENHNDYLVYGMTEEFLRAHPDLMELPFKKTSELVREAGMILCQAHPFRNNMKVGDPALLDGFEAYNAHTASFRNRLAKEWAEEFGLIKVGGSDYHGTHHKAESGIVTDFPITSNEELLATLRSGNYKILNKGEIIELN